MWRVGVSVVVACRFAFLFLHVDVGEGFWVRLAGMDIGRGGMFLGLWRIYTPRVFVARDFLWVFADVWCVTALFARLFVLVFTSFAGA